MDVVTAAPQLLADLFEDGGAAFFSEAGVGDSWPEVLAHVPPEVLQVPPSEAGLSQLLHLRDFWGGRGDVRPALAATRALLQLRARRVGQEHPDTLMELAALGTLVQRAGRPDEGGALLEQAWSQLRSRVGGRDLRLAVVAANVAAHRLRTGRGEAAEHALEIAWRIRTELAPGTEGLVGAQLGEVRLRLGRPEAALEPLKRAWQMSAEADGAAHTRTLTRAQLLGTALNQLERWSDAAAVLGPVYEGLSAHASADHRATVAFELGMALDRSGHKEQALRRIEEAVRLTRQLGEQAGRPHPSLANRLTLMAQLAVQKGRSVEAEGLQLEALEAEKRLHGPSSAQVAQRYGSLGYFYARLGRADEALGWLDPACSLLRSTLGDDHPRTKALVAYLAELLRERAARALDQRDRALAGELVRRGWELAVPVLGHGHEATRQLRLLKERGGLP